MKTIKYVDMIEGREYESIKLPNTYKKENGILYIKIKIKDEWVIATDTMRYIVEEMEFKEIPWTPENGDSYWIPYCDFADGVLRSTFYNDVCDVLRQKRVGIYRTEEEALEKSRELGWIE